MDIASIVAPESAPFQPPTGDAPQLSGPCPWPHDPAAITPLSPEAVVGCWYVVAMDGETPVYQGVLRGSDDGGALAVSGDLYRLSAGAAVSSLPRSHEMLRTDDGWYAQPGRSDYALHLRSMGGAVSTTGLAVNARAYVWEPTRDGKASNRVGDFTRYGDTVLALTPRGSATPVGGLPSAAVLAGGVMVDGHVLELWAVKSAATPRALRLVVHEMEGRPWPADTPYNTDMLARIFRDAGVSMQILRNADAIPSDDSLIRSELDTMLADQVVRYYAGPLWVQHLFLVSSLNWSGLDTAGRFGHIVGMMFDNTDRHRQGVAVFLDTTIESSVEELTDRIDTTVLGRPVARTPQVLLRTAAHEIGHGLGLRHTPTEAAGDRGIMNQIQELLRQVDPATGPLFPENAQMSFDRVASRNLSHRPDPEVCPGWGNWSAPPKGVALGLQAYPERARSLGQDPVLLLGFSSKPANELATSAARPVIMRTFDLGEPVFLELTIRNLTDEPVTVPSSVTLSDGLSEAAVRDPGATRRRLVGTAQTVCEGTGMVRLAPGAEHRHTLQLHSSGEEPVFSRPGEHRVEIAIKTREYGWIEAPGITVAIRPDVPGTRSALAVTGRHPFCEAMALGYIATYRGVSDTDRLLRHGAYPLGARIAAGVLQVATFAEPPAGIAKDRMSPMRPNPGRVQRAIGHLKETGVRRDVVIAVAQAIDPLTESSSAVAEALAAGWDAAG